MLNEESFFTSISCQPESLLTAKAMKAMITSFQKETVTILPEEGKIQLIQKPELDDKIIIAVDQQIEISAATEKNLFHGGMYLLTLWGTQKLEAGIYTIQAPKQQNLLMVDIGRKYFSLDALKKMVDEMALFQFDMLQLHFSENEGFRIECAQYPELVSPEYLTKAEVRELIQYAHSRFIEVIPDFDSPGHLQYILEKYPEWRLDMLNEAGELTKAPKALDILNKDAVTFIRSIYQEYAELFKDSRFFHIGADEFVPFDDLDIYPTLKAYAAEKFGASSSGIEVFIEYVNNNIEFIRSLGFLPMVWSDGFYRANRSETLHLSKDCVVGYWTRWNKNMATIDTYLNAGYQVINYNDNYFYYVLGEHASYTYPSYEKIKEGWQPRLFASNQLISEKAMNQVMGQAVAIWSNIPEAKSELEVAQDIFFVLAAKMQKVLQVDLGEKEAFKKIYEAFFG